MASYTPIYQKRGEDVVPVITIDDAPSAEASAAGHLVDSNGIASALAALEEKIPSTDDFVTLETYQFVHGPKEFNDGDIVFSAARTVYGQTPGTTTLGADNMDGGFDRMGYYGQTTSPFYGKYVLNSNAACVYGVVVEDCSIAIAWGTTIAPGTNTVSSLQVKATYTDDEDNNITGYLPCRVFSVLLQNGGKFSVTWESNIMWSDGTPPELSSDDKFDVLTFITFDGGYRWVGTLSASHIDYATDGLPE